MRKLVATMMTGILLAGSLTGCGTSKTVEDSTTQTYKIGVSQFAQHGSLDNCYEGFVEGLREEGIEEGVNLEIDLQNANADTGTAGQIASNFVSQKTDLMCGIATPSAMACYNAASKANIPTIFTAVTDPVAAQLANEDGTPVGEITGTSDKLPVTEQLQMIRELLPDAQNIGILYTTSEVNSVSAIEEYKEKAADFGFTIVEQGVTAVADVPLATDSLLKKVDCITNLTDNTVVSALPTVLDKANAAGIPVFGSEIEQVKIGCVAAVGLDYVKLGIQTGHMAAKVLKGEVKASEMNFEIIEEGSLYMNQKAADDLGISIEHKIAEAAEVFDTIEG
ncbi:MAG: ABC transporter substrate-binding protein [Lachnospiraceae bacterium]